MNELEAILEAFQSSGGRLQGSVLATVVHVKGSSYRRPGARMLVLPEGHRLGTISGGCLESDVARKARWWVSESATALKTYDTSSEGAAWEFGLGCNGVITLMLEDAGSPAVTEQLEFLAQQLQHHRPSLVATLIRANPESKLRAGARLLWNSRGGIGGEMLGTPLAEELVESIEGAWQEQSHRLVHCKEGDVFVEWIAPPLRVVAFGAGHDAIPLVQFGNSLGWRTTIADNRPQYAKAQRFPGAHRVVQLGEGGSIEGIHIDESTAVVMMTHNYPLDLLLLPQILRCNPRYLGMLGPRSRAEKLFAELALDMESHPVHAPVGLDIGSDHPETIALSIAAEIQSAIAGRCGGSLRLREGPIHGPAFEGGSRRSDPWSFELSTRANSSVELAQCEIVRPSIYA